jgi:hypothetical protein
VSASMATGVESKSPSVRECIAAPSIRPGRASGIAVTGGTTPTKASALGALGVKQICPAENHRVLPLKLCMDLRGAGYFTFVPSR